MYENKILIRSHHVSPNRRLNVSRLLEFFQDASFADVEEQGMGRIKTLEKGLLWVIARQEIRIWRMPVYDETITLRSWPLDTRHILFPRHFEVTDGEAVLISGNAIWILIDAKSRHFVFPEEYGIAIKGELPGQPRLKSIRHNFPETALRTAITPRYADLDINGHMNNSRYFDVIWDLLPQDLQSLSRPLLLESEYTREVRPGESVTVLSERAENAWHFEGRGPDTRFRIRITPL